MKHLALVLFVVLLAVPALGATYSVTPTAAQEAIITRARTEQNAIACASVGLAAGCTQAQANAAQPGAVTVYASNGPYLLSILVDKLTEKYEAQKAADRMTFQTWVATAATEKKDAVCAAAGLSAGCLP